MKMAVPGVRSGYGREADGRGPGLSSSPEAEIVLVLVCRWTRLNGNDACETDRSYP